MSGMVKGKTFELDHIRITIGRSEKNMIRLDDASVSSQHCVLVRDGDRYFVEDVGSTNGTRLNFKPVKNAPLRSKDILRIGSVEFMFDADFIEDNDNPSSISTKIEVLQVPTQAPKSFQSISPLQRKKPEPKGKKTWVILVGVIAVLAIGAVIMLVVQLSKSG